MNEEDFFSDDATLDALAEDELRALEEEAVKSTQMQQEARHLAAQQSYVQPPPPPPPPPPQYHYQQRQPLDRARSAAVQTPFKPPGPQQPLQAQPFQKPTTYISYSQQQRQQQQQWQASTPPPIAQPTYSIHTNQRPFVPPQRQSSNHDQQRQEPPQSKDDDDDDEPTLPIAHHPADATTTTTTTTTWNKPLEDDAEKASSDYGDIEGLEENVELWDPPPATTAQQQQYPPALITGSSDLCQQAASVQDWVERQEELGQIADDVVMANSQYAVPAPYALDSVWHGNGQPQVDVGAYEARIAKLQQQTEQMKQQIQQVQQAKAGEVAIVRNRLDQAGREHERKLASVKKVHAEDSQKRFAEIEALKAERDRLLVEKIFQQKELDEMVRREKAGRKKQEVLVQVPKSQEVVMSGTVDVEAPTNHPATPKRLSKSFALRDGFEDDDLASSSPSKSGMKSRTPTKAGQKRKRAVNGSPLLQLPLSQSRVEIERIPPIIDDKVLERLFAQDDRLEFFEAIILHRYPSTQERIFDALMRFSFPSSPRTTLSSYFLDKLTTLRVSAENKAFAVGVSRVLMGIWSRCLAEKFFGVLGLVVELFRFGILWTQGGHCFEVMDEALHLIQKTVDINAIPMATKRVCVETPDIPATECLEIMEEIALASLGDEVYVKRFWKQIRVDFPIMCLHPAQPLELIRRMTSVLCTSIMNESFGPINSNERLQRQHEAFLLEAVTKPLEMMPRYLLMKEKKKYSAVHVLELRMELLQFLGCVCSVEAGMQALAKHERAVVRVAIRVAEEVDQCYEWRRGEGVRIDFINFAVRLLHGIITGYPEEANGKLATNHKHLVSMARLAFSEGIAQEAGLESDAVDCAFALLENMITPDEAVALEAMFNQ